MKSHHLFTKLLFGMMLLLTVNASSLIWHNTPHSASAHPSGNLDTAQSHSLMFIQNVGQYDHEFQYYVLEGDKILWLSQDALWVTIMEPSTPSGASFAPSASTQRGVHVKLSFIGSNPNPRLEPIGQLDTSVNYILGQQPQNWYTHVPVWSGVRYVDLYPGMDLELITEQHHLALRVVVKNGAEASRVRLHVEGADTLELVSLHQAKDVEGVTGQLNISTAIGEFTLPLANVARFQIEGSTGALIEAQTLDLNHLFASPPTVFNALTQTELSYATFLGGNLEDLAYSLAVDSSGAAYISGSTNSTNFPVTPGAFEIAPQGNIDAFALKLNPGGSSLAYATFLGGAAADCGNSITVDGYGAAYITGYTQSTDFPTTTGALRTAYQGGSRDAFVVKISASGDSLSYATYLGGNAFDQGESITVDGSGTAFIAGTTFSTNFPTTAGAYDQTHNGSSDTFIAKLNSTGSALSFATFLGGSSYEEGYSIALGGSGAVYLAGLTSSSNFPATSGAFDTGYNSNYDAYFAKLNATGSNLVYASYLGGAGYDTGVSIKVDLSEMAYISGYTESSNFPTTSGAFDDTHNGDYDAFVVKTNAEGSSLIYATFLGGNATDSGRSLAIDGSGAVYITGVSASANFPTTAGALDTVLGGSSDAFIAKLNATGSDLVYATFLGGNSYDNGTGIALDGSGAAYIAGSTASGDFPVTSGAFDTSYNGGTNDAFIASLTFENPALTCWISPVYPMANATSSHVMQGGTVYRHFTLSDNAGEPIPAATIGFSVGSPATTDASGHFTYTISADTLGAPGAAYAVSVQSVEVGGQNCFVSSYPTFEIQVEERVYAHSWSYSAIRQGSGGVSTGLVTFIGAETNGGLGLTLEESDPDQTDDDLVGIEEMYALGVNGGVGLGLRENISAGVVKANLSASVTSEALLRHFGNLYASFYQPYADEDRQAQGIFLTLSILDSSINFPIQPLVIGMLRAAEVQLPYLEYISEQRVGTAAKITPLHASVGAEAGFTAKRTGSQNKAATIGFTLLDAGASRLVAIQLTDYGDEYSLGFDDELSVNLTLLSPNVPGIKTRLIGLIGNMAKRLNKEYFYDSSTNTLKRIEITLIGEGAPNVFNDVTKKQVAIRMTLEGENLTPALIEAVGETSVVTDLNTLLNAVAQIPYVVEVEDGSAISVVPEISIPGTEIKIGLGLEVEKTRNLIRERGVFINGEHYLTETYNADSYVERAGKDWDELADNAIGGLWLLVEDAFNWVSEQVTNGTSWLIGTVSKTVEGVIQGGAQLIAPPATQLFTPHDEQGGQTVRQNESITVTAVGWVPENLSQTKLLASKPSMITASGEGFVVGGIYEFQPYTLTLSPAATLVITYTDEAVAGLDENLIGMFRWDAADNNWQPLTATPDIEHNTFTASISQLGTFALGTDATPPSITIEEPLDGSVVANTQPLIRAQLADIGTGIDPASVEMRINGQIVAATYNPSNGELTYLPSMPLENGTYTLTISASDVLGNDRTVSAVFTVEFFYKVYLPLVLDMN